LPDFLKSIFGFLTNGLGSMGNGFKGLLSGLLPDSMTGPDSFLGSLFSAFRDGSQTAADGAGSALDRVKNKVDELGHTKIGGAPAVKNFGADFMKQVNEALTPSPGAVPDSLDWQGRAGFWALDRLPAIRMKIFGEPRNPDGSFDIYSTPEGAFFRRLASKTEAEVKALVKRMEDPEVRKALGQKADELVDWVKSQVPGSGPSQPTQSGGAAAPTGAAALKAYNGKIYSWGDSHAQGIGWALGLPDDQNLGVQSAGLNGGPKLKSVESVTPGSVVMISIGTNDLAGSLLKADRHTMEA
jgi:hypothetical protein